jgi:hypothetical protein
LDPIIGIKTINMIWERVREWITGIRDAIGFWWNGLECHGGMMLNTKIFFVDRTD